VGTIKKKGSSKNKQQVSKISFENRRKTTGYDGKYENIFGYVVMVEKGFKSQN